MKLDAMSMIDSHLLALPGKFESCLVEISEVQNLTIILKE
jgi:hypothetical protein